MGKSLRSSSPSIEPLYRHWTPSGPQDGLAAVAEVQVAKAVAEAKIQHARADGAENQAELAKEEALFWRTNCSLAEARAIQAEWELEDANARANSATEKAMSAEARAVVAEAQLKILKEDLLKNERVADAAVLRAEKSDQRAESAERRAVRAESLARCTETQYSSIANSAVKAEEIALTRVRNAERHLHALHEKAQERIKASEELSHRSMNTASVAIAECQRHTGRGQTGLEQPSVKQNLQKLNATQRNLFSDSSISTGTPTSSPPTPRMLWPSTRSQSLRNAAKTPQRSRISSSPLRRQRSLSNDLIFSPRAMVRKLAIENPLPGRDQVLSDSGCQAGA